MNSSDVVKYEQLRNILVIAGQLLSCIMVIIYLWNVPKHNTHWWKQIKVFKTAEMHDVLRSDHRLYINPLVTVF